MKSLVLLLLSFVIASSMAAQCANQVTVNGDSGDAAAGVIFVFLDKVCAQQLPVIRVGDAIQIESNNKQFSGEVQVIKLEEKFTRLEAVAGGPAAEDAATLTQLTDGAAATITVDSSTLEATINNPNAPLLTITRYEWSIGPATKANDESTPATTALGATADTDENEPEEGAFRLQYEGEYARPGFFGRGTATSRFQTIGTLNIDTTNSDDPGYIDNNRLTLGIQSVDLKTPTFLAQAQVGFEGRLTRSFHRDAQDGDVMATFSTWIPALRSVTILSSVPGYISPPLTVSLSYGYRTKEMPGAKTVSGRGGEATATYYLYALNKYQLTLSGTWTLNDMSDRPADVKRTTRLYKVAIAYLNDPAKGFEVVTSFEDGHVGPLLTKVRQYYVGIATKKFSMSGGSK
jgi:hypothetical protein